MLWTVNYKHNHFISAFQEIVPVYNETGQNIEDKGIILYSLIQYNSHKYQHSVYCMVIVPLMQNTKKQQNSCYLCTIF